MCHSSRDKEFAGRLSEDLKKEGIRVWIDEAEIKVGDSLIEKIEEGIEEMEYLGVILSPDSVKSNWVTKELNVAMAKEIKRKEVKVLPILYKKCKIPSFLEEKKYADFTKDYNQGLSELLDRFFSDKKVFKKIEKKYEYKVEGRRQGSITSFPKGEYRYLVRNYENSVIKLSEIIIEYWHKNFPEYKHRKVEIEDKYLAPFEEKEFIIQVDFFDFLRELQKHIGKQIDKASLLQNILISPTFKFEIDGGYFEKVSKEHSAW
jgi:hypothetical protein